MDRTMEPLRVLDLFSGIGGFTLGLERAGMQTVAFCERDYFCREWLRQQWPRIPCHPDVRQLDARTVGPVDVICGGFPCQDVASAGLRRGLAGDRSGLWFHMCRIVSELRPTFVIIENVTGLRINGGDRVLSDLEKTHYACWPFVVGADDIGFPHRRKRVWIIGRDLAHRDGSRCTGQRIADHGAVPRTPRDQPDGRGSARPDNYQGTLGDTHGSGSTRGLSAAASGNGQHAEPAEPDHGRDGIRPPARPGEPQHAWEAARTVTRAECRLGAAADGLPASLGETYNRARLRAAGNAIVPHIAEIIGRAVIRMQSELDRRAM